MAWLIPVAYVAVWLTYGWRLAVHLVDREIRRTMRAYPHLYPTVPAAVAELDRGEMTFYGFAIALIWPLTAPARGIHRLARLATGTGLFVTPTEKQDARDRELAALRQQAHDLGLPMPNTGDSP
jgi:hypothetical protein